MDQLEGFRSVSGPAPYDANTRKRLDKRPRAQWRDGGLPHAVLNVPDQDTLFHQPWVGASWEGYMIEQILATLQQADRLFEACHFRTSGQREIVLVVELRSERWAVEAKRTTNPRRSDLDRLNFNADLVSAERRFLACRQSDFIEANPQPSAT